LWLVRSLRTGKGGQQGGPDKVASPTTLRLSQGPPKHAAANLMPSHGQSLDRGISDLSIV
jgi:hypothetical protein